MEQQPTGQAPSPDNGQAPDPNKTPTPGSSQPAGGDNNGDEKVEISKKELDSLRRDAGRWRKPQSLDRKERREPRRERGTRSDRNTDDPEILDEIKVRDSKINELSSVNKRLIVKDRVRDLLDSEDYQSLPPAIKKAVARNPLGFVREDSTEVEHFIEDIQDYLEEELDGLGSGQNNPAPKETKPTETRQTPPASGSGPSAPKAAPDEDVAGKTGPARSTTILKNLLKNRGRS